MFWKKSLIFFMIVATSLLIEFLQNSQKWQAQSPQWFLLQELQ